MTGGSVKPVEVGSGVTRDPRPALLPCPFCGSEKLTTHCDENRDDIHIFFVMCDKCGAEGPSLYADTPPFSYQFDGFGEDCRNVARAKWNARASNPTPPSDGDEK